MVLNAIKGIYSDFGLPKRVLTNNGACFKSRDFTEFHAKLGVKVEHSSTYNHQSGQCRTHGPNNEANFEKKWRECLVSHANL